MSIAAIVTLLATCCLAQENDDYLEAEIEEAHFQSLNNVLQNIYQLNGVISEAG